MENINTKISEEYQDYILTHGERPKSVARFMKNNLNATESEFYEHFSSFENLEQSIWFMELETCLDKMQSEAIYQEYSIREKLLALYYTLIEQLKEKRDFAKYTFSYDWLKAEYPVLQLFKAKFDTHIEELVKEGGKSGEVSERMFISEHYTKALWWQMIFLLRFWVNDESKSFESSDVAIEKSVNLMMDALGENIADSTFDFVRFMIQNK